MIQREKSMWNNFQCLKVKVNFRKSVARTEERVVTLGFSFVLVYFMLDLTYN